ncbi:type 11 methyltransferase, partial [Thauera phenylacetica B4P]
MSRPTDPAQPGFDARRFKAMERAGFNRIAARYADGAHLRAD